MSAGKEDRKIIMEEDENMLGPITRDYLTGLVPLVFSDPEGREYGWNMEIEHILGEGASSVTYSALVRQGEDAAARRMIFKHFYPDPRTVELELIRDGLSVRIRDEERVPFPVRADFERLGEEFDRAYETQSNLANEDLTMSAVVHPVIRKTNSSERYVLYAANNGRSLDQYPDILNDPAGLVPVLADAAEKLARIHRKGFIMVDITPANILLIDGREVRYFDFDAAIALNELAGDPTLYRVKAMIGRPGMIAPEIRGEINADNIAEKISGAVDVYALGAILFRAVMGRDPELSDNHEFSFERELSKRAAKNGFNKAAAGLLREVLEGTLTESRSERLTADQLAGRLRTLSGILAMTAKDAADDFRKINYSRAAAYLLDSAPLYTIGSEERDGKKIYRVLIAGSSPLREQFLRHIFACAQMPETQLEIYFAAPDASDFQETLTSSYPQLAKVVRMEVNGESVSDGLGAPEITDEPFAGFHFSDVLMAKDDLEDYLEGFLERGETVPAYILLADEDVQRNKDLAFYVAEMLDSHHNGKTFLSYGSDCEDDQISADFKARDWLVTAPFLLAPDSREEKLFEQEIMDRAFRIHRMYMRDWNERATEAEAREDFKSGDHYNIRSSLRAALSIKYKLAAIGFPYRRIDPGAAGAFYRNVLAGTDAANENLELLMWLEHRSWMCFMVMEGYESPTEAEIEAYAYRHGNDHRDKERKLHPLLTASRYGSGNPLETFSHDRWANPDEAAELALDPLDQRSLFLHRLTERRTAEVNIEPAVRDIAREIEGSQNEERISILLEKLLPAAERMRAGAGHANDAWRRITGDLREEIKKSGRTHAEDILKNTIGGQMRAVIARNEYHNYKNSDRAIIFGLPRLLMEEYRRVIKPVSENVWENVMSSVVLSEEELILVTEDGREEEPAYLLLRERAEKFLREKRGMTRMSVKLLPVERIRQLGAVKAVVDVTGADRSVLIRLEKMTNIEALPRIQYRDGTLRAIGESGGEINYYNHRTDLTVEEMLMLSAGMAVEPQRADLLLSDGQRCRAVFRAWQNMRPEAWKALVKLVVSEDAGRYYYAGNRGTIRVCESRQTSARLLRDTGLDEVFDKLKTLGAVTAFDLPEERGPIRFETGCEKLADILDRLLHRAENDPYRLSFRAGEDERRVFIYENSAELTACVEDETLLAEALACLARENLAEYALTRQEDGRPLVRVTFRDEETRQILLTETGAAEGYLYNLLLDSGVPDDIRLAGEFVLAEDAPEEEREVLADMDIAAVFRMRGVFIFVMSEKPSRGELALFRSYAERFGIEGKAVVIVLGDTGAGADLTEKNALYLGGQQFLLQSGEEIERAIINIVSC